MTTKSLPYRFVFALTSSTFHGPNTGGWQNRHYDALVMPASVERPITTLLHGWALYADQHRARYESGIGEDYVLGANWSRIGGELRGLLNGELGRLDGGTLDRFICRTLEAEGFAPDPL